MPRVWILAVHIKSLLSHQVISKTLLPKKKQKTWLQECKILSHRCWSTFVHITLHLSRSFPEIQQKVCSTCEAYSHPHCCLSLSRSHTHQYIADYNRDLCQTSPILSPCVGDVSWTETSGRESEHIVSVFLFPPYRLSPSLPSFTSWRALSLRAGIMSVITKSRQARCPQGFYQPARTQSIIQPCSTESGGESTVLLTPHLSRPKRRGKSTTAHARKAKTLLTELWLTYETFLFMLLWTKMEWQTVRDRKIPTCTCRPGWESLP